MSFPQRVATVVRHGPPLRGRGALAYRWFARSGDSTVEWNIAMSGGYRLIGAQGSCQTWSAAFLGRYAEDAVEALAPFVKPATSILDIGGSLGFFSVPAAIAARDRGASVVVYEPVPANVRLIELNVATNDLADTVEIRPIGLGARSGDVEMGVEWRGVGNAAILDGIPATELDEHRRTAGALRHTVRVPISTLDAEVFSQPCSALKIDVEGFELDVFRGGVEFIARNRPAIYAEFAHGWLASRGEAVDAPQRWAESNDYVAFGYPPTRPRPWLEPRTNVPERMTGPWMSGDVLLVPRERLDELDR